MDSSKPLMKILQKYTNNYELHIKIESDKEFYNCKYKTGLGSSSALVTSLCGSIYSLFLYLYIYIVYKIKIVKKRVWI